jgi:hypothetical protein
MNTQGGTLADFVLTEEFLNALCNDTNTSALLCV